MALQSALHRLRNARSSNSGGDKDTPAEICQPCPAPSLVFSVDEAEKDLFNFSDDEFLDDSVFSLPSCLERDPGQKLREEVQDGTASGATNLSLPLRQHQAGHNGGTLDCNRSNTDQPQSLCSGSASSVTSSQTYGSQTKPSNQGLTKSFPQTNHSSGCKNSPSISSLHKLKSFKFVKMSSTTSKQHGRETERNTPPHTSPPPAKRKPVSVRANPPVDRPSPSSESETHKSSHSVHTHPLSDHSLFKQPSLVSRETAVPHRHPPPAPGGSAVQTQRGPSAGSCSQPPQNHKTLSSNHYKAPTPSIPTTPLLHGGQNHSQLSRQSSNNSSTRFTTPSRSGSSSQRQQQDIFLTPTCPPSRRVQSTPTGATAQLRTPSSVARLLRTPTSSSVRRRFPGPAGILPVLAPGQSMDGISIPPPSTPTPASTPRRQHLATTPAANILPGSQGGERGGGGGGGGEGGGETEDFSQGPWVDMLQDLDMDDIHSRGLLRYNIARTLRQAARQKLRNGKVVHLRVLLKNIIPAGKNSSAVLKDPTGEILCTIGTRAMENFQREFQPGAVLILRQVSVFSPSPRKHYLNITTDNIVRVYPPHHLLPDGPTARRPLLLMETEKQYLDSDRRGLQEHQGQEDDRFGSVLQPCGSVLNSRHSPDRPGILGREMMEVGRGTAGPSSLTRCDRPPYQSGHRDIGCKENSSVRMDFGKQTSVECGTRSGVSVLPHSRASPELSHDGNTAETAPVAASTQSIFSAPLSEDEFDDLFSNLTDASFMDF